MKICTKCKELKQVIDFPKGKYWFKSCFNEYNRNHPPKENSNKKYWMKGSLMFGGNREQAIQRDGEKCVKCGMTRAEHIAVYGHDITVDHIDKRGSKVKDKNNSLDNLQTLCLKCHSYKDNVFKKVTHQFTLDGRYIRSFATSQDAARSVGVNPTTLSACARGKVKTVRGYKWSYELKGVQE